MVQQLTRFLSLAMSTFAVAVCLPMVYGQSDNAELNRDLAPTGKGIGTIYNPGQGGDHFAGPPKGGSSSNGISYHGGPVMLNTTNIYYIWYGDWSGNTATTILTDLANGISGSPYFNINTTYYNGSNTHVSNSVSYKAGLFVASGDPLYMGT